MSASQRAVRSSNAGSSLTPGTQQQSDLLEPVDAIRDSGSTRAPGRSAGRSSAGGCRDRGTSGRSSPRPSPAARYVPCAGRWHRWSRRSTSTGRGRGSAFTAVEQGVDEVGLLRGFAARHGDAGQERSNGGSRRRAPRPAAESLRGGVPRADGQAGVAATAGVAVPFDLAGQRKLQRTRRAGRDAVAAVVAGVDRVRVVARDAVEVAALQEHDEPVARTVDVGERDGVSDQARVYVGRSWHPIRFTARWVRWYERPPDPAAR